MFKNDNENNIIINSWSIIFINKENLNKGIIPLFLENNIENNIFNVIYQMYTQLIKENEDFNNKKDIILEISKLINQITGKENIVYNLAFDRNYLANMKFNSNNEIENIKNKINNETKIIDNIISKLKIINIENRIFNDYKKDLENQLLRLNNINEINNIKQNIFKKIEGIKDERIKIILKKEIEKKKDINEFKELYDLIDNLIIRYDHFNCKKQFKKIFLKDGHLFTDINNKNIKLIDLLLKYSEIKELIEENKNKNNKLELLYLEKLLNLINDSDVIEVIANYFLQKNKDDKEEDNEKILEAYLFSMFTRELVDNELEENFIKFPNLFNNLYDIKNRLKFDNNWCYNIERKYKFDTKIYIPKINILSFLLLFIGIDNLNEIKYKKGILDENEDLFEYFKKNVEYLMNIIKDNNLENLILEIGKLIFYKFFKEECNYDLNSLCNEINKKINSNNIDYNIDKKLLENFLKYKELFLNIKDEHIIFDELESKEKGKKRKKLFNTKYPSLINYLNYNYNIYNKLINEILIFDFAPDDKDNYIPLWLLVLRILGNSDNIKVSFITKDEETVKFEKEFVEKIKQKQKCFDLNWLLLILPNNTCLIENEFSERFYNLFNYLLIEISNFSKNTRMEIRKTIENFIYDIFDKTYEKGIEYIIKENNILFEIVEQIKEKIEDLRNINYNKFIKEKNFLEFKKILNTHLNEECNDSLNNIIVKFIKNTNNFENLYNETKKEKCIDKRYKLIENICKKYNDYIDTNNEQEKENLKDTIQDYMKKEYIKYKDISNLFVELVDKKVYIKKNKEEIYCENYQILFNKGSLKKDIFFSYLNRVLKIIKKLYEFFDILSIDNIEYLEQLKGYRKRLELIIGNFQIYIEDKSLFKEISKKMNIDLKSDLDIILQKINEFINYINYILEKYEELLLPIKNDKPIFEKIKKEIDIYIPDLYPNNPNEKKFEEIISKKDINISSIIIPYFLVNNKMIEGFDHINIDLGLLNLYDSNFQKIYFASFNDINIQLEEENQGSQENQINQEIKLFKKTKLYMLLIQIPKKKKKEIEINERKVKLKLLYNNNIEKKVLFNINFKTELIKIYLQCDEYKMKYNGENLFTLSTSFLFKNEVINFTIINNSFSPKVTNQISIQSSKNNTSKEPGIIINNNKCSLIINSMDKKEYLSFYLNIFIGNIFKFKIKIEANIKTFNYVFSINYSGMFGFISNNLNCSFDVEDFELLINAQENREFNYLIKYKDISNNIEKIEGENQGVFFGFKKIKYKIKLKQKIESKIELICLICEIEKKITINFKEKSELNYGIQRFDGKTLDKENFFCFYLDELGAQGLEKYTFKGFEKRNKNPVKYEYGNDKKNINISNLEISLINIPNINIQNLYNFYNEIIEFTLLFPIYYNSYYIVKKDKNLKKKKKDFQYNYFLLYKIYNKLKNQENNHNYFSKEINEFIHFFSELMLILDIPAKSEEKNNINPKKKDIKNKSDSDSGIFNNDNSSSSGSEKYEKNINQNNNIAKVNKVNNENKEVNKEINKEVNKKVNNENKEVNKEVNNENKEVNKEVNNENKEVNKKVNNENKEVNKEINNENKEVNKEINNENNKKKNDYISNQNNNEEKVNTNNNNIIINKENNIWKVNDNNEYKNDEINNTEKNDFNEIKEELSTLNRKKLKIQKTYKPNGNTLDEEYKSNSYNKNSLKIIRDTTKKKFRFEYKNNKYKHCYYFLKKEEAVDIKHPFEKDLNNYNINLEISDNENRIIFDDNYNKEDINDILFNNNDIKQYILMDQREEDTYIKKNINDNIQISNDIEKNNEEDDGKFLSLPFDNENIFNKYDLNIINKIIQNIKEGEKENYEVIIDEPPYEPSKLNKDEDKVYIINDLLKISKIYIDRFFVQLSKCDIELFKFSFCFVLDCSLYMGLENKLINLMIVLSILKVIEMINIKFSILLTADDKFKIIIKKYEETINFEDLIERIYETIILKRYKNNITKSIKIAVDYMKNKTSNNLLFLVFCDYLDDSMVNFNYWKNNILNNSNDSFIFFMENTHNLDKSQQELVNKMWKDFEQKANEQTNSKIKLINFAFSKSNYKIINEIDIFKDISEFFNEIFIKNDNDNYNYNYNDIKNDNIINNINSNIENTNNQTLDIKHFEEILDYKKFKKYNKIYYSYEKNQINIKNKINIKNDIELPNNGKKELPEIKDHISKILQFYQDKNLIDSIFYPNKATQKQLSTRGSEIDFLQLILYTLFPTQEPMFYLEEKGGMIRDYSITLIIDNSKTCFSKFNEKHSYLTLINFLKIIYTMAIPSFDLIVTGEYNNKSKILLFDKPSITIFKDNTSFKELLLLLSNPIINPDLGKAIETAYILKKKKRNERESYLFILTDGLLHKKNEENISLYINQCQIIGMRVIGIGLGIYPYKAQKLFKTFIYSTNPEDILKGISILFEKIIKTEKELKILSDYEKVNEDEFRNIFDLLENISEDKFLYKSLREELKSIGQGDDVLNSFNKKEVKVHDKVKSTVTVIDKGYNLEIYSENLLKTQKILIVMLWSYELNKKEESSYIDPKYIDKDSDINGTCIRACIEHFGIEDYIVVDYENAIKELLKKKDNSYCEYYSVWIFCGPQNPILPPRNGEENLSNPYLVEEFINILIAFWKNGGSLVFFADGDPLNFQVNLFLEKIDFSQNEKPKFRISGNYNGDNLLKPDKTGNLQFNGSFDKSKKKSYYKGVEVQRQSLSHNLGYIYEGLTISYAVDINKREKITIDNKEMLKPFIPFSVNSEGGINTLVYESDEKGRGDIIIDCGYTKCFLNMRNTGSYRFIQNIAGWTARPEIIYSIEKKNPWEWRPKCIKYNINYNSYYKGFLSFENNNPNNLKTLLLIDRSESTKCSIYERELNPLLNEFYDEQRGDVIYIWGSTYQKLNKKKFFYIIENGDSLNIAIPELIPKIIENEESNDFKHLMIITNSLIPKEKKSYIDNEMNNINFNFEVVSVYIIRDNIDNIDESIWLPFCRSSSNKIYKKNKPNEDFQEITILSEYNKKILNGIENYDTYKDFMENYNKILNVVREECLEKTNNSELEIKLLNLFERIIVKEKNMDNEFYQRKNTLLAITKGLLPKPLSLVQIKAAFYDYGKEELDFSFLKFLIEFERFLSHFRMRDNSINDIKDNNNIIPLNNEEKKIIKRPNSSRTNKRYKNITIDMKGHDKNEIINTSSKNLMKMNPFENISKSTSILNQQQSNIRYQSNKKLPKIMNSSGKNNYKGQYFIDDNNKNKLFKSENKFSNEEKI